MTRKRRRMAILLACGLGLGSATALSLSAFSNDMVFFVAPSDLPRRAYRAVRCGWVGWWRRARCTAFQRMASRWHISG